MNKFENMLYNHEYHILIMANITYDVSDWSICHDFMDRYIRYRNISIYQNGNFVLNTYYTYNDSVSLFNIEESCKKTNGDIPYDTIIYIVIMIGLCIFGCKCSGNCPTKTSPE